ncbi:MAG: FKBP-type peptidyl-prolyl cis-trans isomerase [Muribaculaceae bacterium]|nr:FKBP-type peptidyl-prolyl cis-trans isomerase [Muribaculaceae bacterium]
MKKTFVSIAMAGLALVSVSCNNSASGVSEADKAFNDSIAVFMGRANGAMLAQNMDQLPAEELAKFKKESFLRGFKSVLMADTGDVAYQYGVQIGLNIARQLQMFDKDSVNVDREKMFSNFSKAFLADSINQTELTRDMGTFEGLMQQVQQKIQSRQMQARAAQEASRAAQAEENKAKGAEYIANAIKEDAAIKTTESGLAYKVVKQGTGATPTESDLVKVHYTGKLIDGTVFDSSVDRGEPADFAITQVVPGFGEGLKMMNKGSKYILYIPSNLAYGDNATGSIPAGSTLVFEVEVLDITAQK